MKLKPISPQRRHFHYVIGHRIRRCLLFVVVQLACTTGAVSQEVYTLLQLRELALENNKQLNASRQKKHIADDTRLAARTLRLPRVNVFASYQLFDREASLLNASQKQTLSTLGTSLGSALAGSATDIISSMVGSGIITPATAGQLADLINAAGGKMTDIGNNIGGKIRSAFRTDTHQMWLGNVLVTQPVYMGGAITAANNIAEINSTLIDNEIEKQRQSTLYDIDKTYWTIVALAGKQALAESYLGLVSKLDSDVHAMIDEGVATRADGLKVDVRVNEAEMQKTQVDNGLSLAKMLLCQLCGLPIGCDIRLADEDSSSVNIDDTDVEASVFIPSARSEIRMMEGAVALSRENMKLTRAAYLPQVALTGGYLLSNPNVFNGFERRFRGTWNVGITARVPLWNWHEGRYKSRIAETAVRISQIELEELTEKIGLQVEQERFKVQEAKKKYTSTVQNIRSAEENLRCADLGFREGVIDATDVMAAQTAWKQAKSQQIDAEVEFRLATVALRKALGNIE